MESHNGAVFETETNPSESHSRQRNGNGKHSPKDKVAAATGGLDLDRSDDENSPLLGSSDTPSDDGDPMSQSGMLWEGKKDFEGMPWWNTPAVMWLLPCFLLSALAFGGILVPKLNLILDLICREYMADMADADPNFTALPIVFGEDNSECRLNPGVQKRVAEFTLYGNLISGLLSAVMAPKLGALSDRYGRKKIMILTNVGTLIGEIITIIAAKYPETFHVNWILLGFVFDGLSGSFITAMAISHSYATDCTPPAKRAVSFAYFHGCLFTGIALGPFAAGYIVEHTGSILTIFYIALGTNLLFILLLLFVIPESLSKARQRAAQEKYAADLDAIGPAADWINQIRSFNLLEPLKVLYPTGPGSSPELRRNLILLASVDTITFGVAMGSVSVVILYIGYEFNWTTLESSQFISIVNTCRVISLIVILPIVTRLVRGKNSARRERSSGSDLFDLNVIRFGILCDVLGFLGYTLARRGEIFTISGALASVGGIGSPTLQSALTKHVPQDQTGQLLGAMGLLHAMARVISPTIFNIIYSRTVGGFTQAVFVCLTATFALAFGVSWFIRPHVYLDEQDQMPVVPMSDDEDDGVEQHFL